MLHKTHNSVVTFFILLTLVGVSKPAKAFLLAQSDVSPTFTVPEELPQDAAVKIATSNSTSSIAKSLKKGFSGKYPQAQVTIEAQSSGEALDSLSEGQADLVAIGRNLTNAEKEQGFISVPVSREKIAIVISKNNSYNGNLTIGEFAQIFRGEITDWSELGRGTPGTIKLVDLPDTNDTRQAFPNYPVFQEEEFSTGANAVKLDQDRTESMIAKLGPNAIGYAVVNDVINRDDIEIVTMHKTQPDDQRYPFSQPFNLIYQGTPSEATQAYLGFATTEGGEEVVSSRVGSISPTAAGAIASGLANKSGQNNAATIPPVNQNKNRVDSGTDADTDNPDINAGADTDADAGNPDINAGADADADLTKENDVVADANVSDADLKDSGELNNPDVEDSGELNNPDVEDSGELNNPDVEGSGELNPDIEGSGELNPDVEGSGERLSVEEEATTGETVVPNTADEAPGEEVTAKKGKWWWLLPLLGIPLLAAMIAFGGRKKSDREPAIGNLPNAPDGRSDLSGNPGVDDVPPVGANVAGNTVGTTSKSGNATLASGAALAGGAAAANLANRRSRVDNNADIDLDLDLDEPDTINEIPSNPVSEFTGQETTLQLGDQSTKLQVDEDFENVDSGLTDNTSQGKGAIAGGAAALGGVTAAEFRNDSDTSINEVVENSDLDTEAEPNVGDVTNGEFRGDFVLQEETKESSDTINVDPSTGDTPSQTAEDVTVTDTVGEGSSLELDLSEEDTAIDSGSGIIDRTTQAGIAAVGGSAAAADAFFNRNRSNEDEDTAIDTPELDLSLDDDDTEIDPFLDLSDQTTQIEDTSTSGFFNRGGNVGAPVDAEFISEESNSDPNSDIIERTTQAGTASSGFFNRNRDNEAEAPVDAEFTSDQDTAIDFPELDSDFNLNQARTVGETTTPELDLSLEDERTSDSDLIDGTSSIDETTTPGFFNRQQDIERASDPSGFEDFVISTETTPSNFGSSLDDITFEDAVEAEDLSLEEITFEDADSSVNASLEDITFDDAVEAEDLSLEEIAFEDTDNSVNASLENITFDDAVEAEDLSLEEITSDNIRTNSINNLVNDVDTNTNSSEINLDDLGFDEITNSSSNDLLSSSQADITSLSDEQSNDLNNISEWLDTLATPKKETDNISEWLDTLDSDNIDFQERDSSANKTSNLTEENEVSFQFLEDLLERDSNKNRDNQQ